MAKNPKMTICRNCNTAIAANARQCPACGARNRKPFYKRGWFLILVMLAVIGIFSTISRKNAERKERANEYRWPDSELAAMIPKPDSPYGRINSDSADTFRIDIYKITEKQYEDYVDSCREEGFREDYNRTDGYYSADNETGYSLRISYADEEKEMEISLYAPDDQGEEESAGSGTEEADGSGQTEDGTEQSEDVTGGDIEQSESAGSSGELIDGMRPEFRDAMDSYEAFYEEYCEFMKEYSENPSDLSLLKQYTELLGKMEDMDEKFQAWEDGDMNQAETEYYMEVHMRILQMLSEISMPD